MSSDEEDYMSDAFLQKCVDTRPGLAPKHAQQKTERERRQKEADTKSKTLPRHKLEAAKREAGLNASIAPSSKGFALLQKMGYKPGMGIGKEGTGRVEPVRIELKTGRSGLGRESELKRRTEEVNQMRFAMQAKRRKEEEKLRESFKGRASERFSEKNVERDLRTAQRACLQLDQEKGLSEPEREFFWPANSLPSRQEEEEEEEEEDESEKAKRELRQRLRLSDRHDDSDIDDSGDDEDRATAEADFSEMERLDIVTRYLRNVYFYCIWCGTKYDDEQDLLLNCPGNSSDAHN